MLAMIVVFAAGYFPLQAGNEASNKQQNDSLEEQRIKYLQTRIDYLEVLFKQGRVGTSDLVEPTLQLLNAKLDYAKSDDEREQIYDEMLKEYDRLIEITEANEKSGLGDMMEFVLSNRDSLFLKAERIRILTERNSIR